LKMFLEAAIAIAIAEIGDKTQLISMGFATRLRLRTIVFGVFLGIILNQLVATIAGVFISTMLPLGLVKILAGISFIIFALASIGQHKEENTAAAQKAKFAPILAVAVSFMIAELGDKTQLFTLSYSAANPNEVVWVFLGTAAGMLFANMLGITVGRMMGRGLPKGIIKWVSAGIFTVFGVMTILEPLSLMLGMKYAIIIILIILCLAFIGGIIIYDKKRWGRL